MEKENIIFGIHSVLEALKNDKDIEKIILLKDSNNFKLKEIEGLAKKNTVKISYVPIQKFKKFENLNHQGVIAYASQIEYQNFEQVTEKILTETENPIFLLLDGVTDVRNLGAILRTAECTGVNAIVLPKSGSAQVNNETIKTSAGAAFNLNICKVDHLKDAIFYLKSSGVKTISITEKTENSIYDTKMSEPIAIIMGSEGVGIQPSILKLTDEKAKLPMLGNIESLNVSVACGAVLYESLRQRLDS
ncbi:23S rRNA (guanosine(2251)-2'-O)-methyltransferase RlmB [Psychroflexus aestuariivivens]|uniref:23S rRNA (guanosine(2251)-2'-O)-methyltransferase RlmB n=1 Tax=Psychroflexus aestuariivivens TaxID=1795040 RepID=UPI000FD77005|nr:23S rRNA (guanosine(2251)-2'-O)-methyltransferase RlmB [Psychroflexus aestuariivivens]